MTIGGPKFSGKRAKLKIQQAARRRLGAGSLVKLFERAAAHFGEVWSGNKADGYVLLRRVLDLPTGVVSRAPSAKKATRVYAQTDAFLLSWEWRTLRMRVLKKFGARCQCCGASAQDGARIHVDHIKPRSTHPELALIEANLQVLCDECNQGKGNWDDTDWRPRPPVTIDDFAPVWRTKQ